MSDRRVQHPRGRRRLDRLRIAPWENWYRDVVLVFVTAFVLVAVIKSNQAVNNQRHDRAVTAGAICGAVNAVITAGRATITGGASGVTGEFERNLRKLGYPPRKVRRQQAKRAADLYAKSIAASVAKSTQVDLSNLVNPNGTLDCKRLPLVANAK